MKAASGALAMLTSQSEKICKKVFDVSIDNTMDASAETIACFQFVFIEMHFLITEYTVARMSSQPDGKRRL